VSIIRAVVEAKSLRQIDVVALVGRYAPAAGISQPDISRILRGSVNGYSESRLIVILAALVTMFRSSLNPRRATVTSRCANELPRKSLGALRQQPRIPWR